MQTKLRTVTDQLITNKFELNRSGAEIVDLVKSLEDFQSRNNDIYSKLEREKRELQDKWQSEKEKAEMLLGEIKKLKEQISKSIPTVDLMTPSPPSNVQPAHLDDTPLRHTSRAPSRLQPGSMCLI